MEQFDSLMEMEMRKNQTRACMTCKKRHQKCTGTYPCGPCVIRGVECNYLIQHKRGPKPKRTKVDHLSNQLVLAQSIATTSIRLLILLFIIYYYLVFITYYLLLIIYIFYIIKSILGYSLYSITYY